MGRFDSYWNTHCHKNPWWISLQECLNKVQPVWFSGFHIHRQHDLAENCSSCGDVEGRGYFCFLSHLPKVATKREWLELRAAGTRSKFSFDAGLLGVLSSLGKMAATTIRNLTISTMALMG